MFRPCHHRRRAKNILPPTTMDTQDVVEFLAAEYGFSVEEAMNKLSARDTPNTTSKLEQVVEKDDLKAELKAELTAVLKAELKALLKAELQGGEEPASTTHVTGGKPTIKKMSASKPTIKKMSVPLPFCGVIETDWCQGVRRHHQLYTQCTNPRLGTGKYCKTCQRHADANGGVLKQGDVSSLPNPNAISYVKVMKDFNITREAAEAAAAELGWTIDEEHFMENSRPPRKRGRPRNNRNVITLGPNNEGLEAIAAILQNQNTEEKRAEEKRAEEKHAEEKHAEEVVEPVEETKNADTSGNESDEGYEGKPTTCAETKENEPNVSQVEEDEDGLEVEEITLNGVEYLIDADGLLYDIETEEMIGEYDRGTKKIEIYEP